MKHYSVPIFVMAVLLLFAGTSYAEIRVVSVKGTASYKAGGQWVPLQTGTALAAGTKVSTGVRSRVEIKINRHTVTVEPLTIMKINENTETADSSTTRLGLRRGSVRTKVARDARIRTVFRVSTPVATSSVRGTEQIVGYSPTFGMWIVVVTGTVEGQGLNSGAQLISGDLKFQQNLVSGGSESPMSGLQESLTNTNPKFVTIDEATAAKIFGDDFIFYGDGAKILQNLQSSGTPFELRGLIPGTSGTPGTPGVPVVPPVVPPVTPTPTDTGVTIILTWP